MLILPLPLIVLIEFYPPCFYKNLFFPASVSTIYLNGHKFSESISNLLCSGRAIHLLNLPASRPLFFYRNFFFVDFLRVSYQFLLCLLLLNLIMISIMFDFHVMISIFLISYFVQFHHCLFSMSSYKKPNL